MDVDYASGSNLSVDGVEDFSHLCRRWNRHVSDGKTNPAQLLARFPRCLFEWQLIVNKRATGVIDFRGFHEVDHERYSSPHQAIQFGAYGLWIEIAWIAPGQELTKCCPVRSFERTL